MRTYHIWVEWRGDLLGIELIPVDGREKHVILDFNLRKHKYRTLNQRPLIQTSLHRCPPSKPLQSHRCSPAAWSCLSAAGPPADASPRWKCWVSAAAACSECCHTSPLCFGCRTGAEEGRTRTVSNHIRQIPAVCNESLQWNDGATHQAVEHLIENGSQTPPVYCPVIRLLVQNLGS